MTVHDSFHKETPEDMLTQTRLWTKNKENMSSGNKLQHRKKQREGLDNIQGTRRLTVSPGLEITHLDRENYVQEDFEKKQTN